MKTFELIIAFVLIILFGAGAIADNDRNTRRLMTALTAASILSFTMIAIFA